jgi:hypothetical protein
MPTHDYTKYDGQFGSSDDPDDFEIAGDITAGDRSADEIESSSSFNTVPPGEHLLVISGFPEPPKEAHYKVLVNNRLDSFAAHSVRVRFHLDGHPNFTITDFFLLPPSDPRSLNAYYNGTPEGKKQAGWAASKFIHFINRLGYPFPPGAKLPEAARRLGNWKGRTIIATVEAGKGTYMDSSGVEKPRGNQIKPFSYRTSEQTVQGATASMRANGPARANNPAPVQPKGTNVYAAGLDNL